VVQVYNDPQLNALEEHINVSNESLRAAFEGVPERFMRR